MIVVFIKDYYYCLMRLLMLNFTHPRPMKDCINDYKHILTHDVFDPYILYKIGH